MTLTAKRIHMPALDYGYLQTGHAAGRRFSLPPGKAVVYCPPMARPFSEYLTMGVTAIYRNASPPADFAQAGCCRNNKDLTGFGLGRGKRSIHELTEAEMTLFAQQQAAHPDHQYKYYTSQMQEAYGEDAPWALHAGSDQKRWFLREFAPRQMAKGGFYFDSYDGAPGVSGISSDLGDTEMFRNALSDPATALNLCRQADPMAYFTDGYRYHDGLVNTYPTAVNDWRRFEMRTLLNMLLWRKGMQGLAGQAGGASQTRKLCGFGWFGEAQSMRPDEWHIRYKQPAPGGHYEIARPGRWNPESQLQTALYTLLFCDVLFCWESGAAAGTDPAIQLPPGSGTGDNSAYHGTGGVSFAPYPPMPNVDNAPAPFPAGPAGYQDLPLVACEWVSVMHAHAGWNNLTFCAARPAGSTNPFAPVTDAYVIDQHQQNRPMCFFGGGAGGKGWLIVSDFSGPGGQLRSYEVATPLGSVTVSQTSHTIRPYLLYP